MAKDGQWGRLGPSALMACALFAVPAPSWSRDDFTRWYTNLSAEDVSLIRDAAISLYVDKRPALLDQASWSSEASGANGTVRIVETNADVSCILLRHEFQEGADEPQKILEIRRCRSANGDWLVEVE